MLLPYNPGLCKKIGSCFKRNIGKSLNEFEAIGAKSKNVQILKMQNWQSIERNGVINVLPFGLCFTLISCLPKKVKYYRLLHI